MISRFVLAACLAVLMVVTGISTYIYLGGRQSRIAVAPQKPTAATPRPAAFTLPGTLFLAQDGALYSLSAGRFHQLTAEAGWSEPALTPNPTNLLAIKRGPLYSDVYVITRYGSVVRQVTNNAGPARDSDTGAKHWSFYPRQSPDGRTLFMDYDQPKFGYDVVLSIWGMPANGTIGQGKLWTNAIDYTGGDVQPIPLSSNSLIYTKFQYYNQKLIGQLWYTNRAYSYGKPLTGPTEDCKEPAMSPDGTQVAMICTYGKQISYLTIASWNGSTLGPRQTILTSQLVAQPVWAPDGSGIAYLAPAIADGPFQLWWLPSAYWAPPPPIPAPVPTPIPGGPHNCPLPTATPVAAPTPPPVRPIQVTANLGFDATSPLAWSG